MIYSGSVFYNNSPVANIKVNLCGDNSVKLIIHTDELGFFQADLDNNINWVVWVSDTPLTTPMFYAFKTPSIGLALNFTILNVQTIHSKGFDHD